MDALQHLQYLCLASIELTDLLKQNLVETVVVKVLHYFDVLGSVVQGD